MNPEERPGSGWPVLFAVFGICLLPIGCIQMLGEGPQPPDGRIGWDSAMPLRLFLIFGASITFFVASVWAHNRSKRR